MYDPVGGFLRIRELYLAYLETAFRIGNNPASRERREIQGDRLGGHGDLLAVQRLPVEAVQVDRIDQR